MKRLLVVEDEKIMAKNIAFFLEREGYQVDVEYDGQAAWTAFKAKAYHLVLLDWTLPKLDGLELCRRIRKDSDVPIIMITAKGEILDKIIGLEIGADDYIVKPFDQRELLARIHALLRRSESLKNEDSDKKYLQYDGLKLDREKLLLTCGEQSISLTANEYKLMEIVIKRPHNVYSREFLYEQVWGEMATANDRTVDVTISRLRKKLMDLSGKRYFHAVRGMGYRLGEES
ncbi:MAG: response regulator transcription factor [Firmicutes bacterium]|nr:response regulator transcription factor [Bacillota bacterium]